ncbi:MAG TPA: ATP-binding protein [Verrucomicrobiae bacterium]|jgi:PAS domain S-box-containing protein|nr:ATP-binding protein [Verrucomicrobiae bacterium]
MSTTNDFIPRILVVDDNQSIHDDFRKTLLGTGSSSSQLADLEAELFTKPGPTPKVGPFRVDFALQGHEALALVEAALKANDPFSLAFIDIRMPPGWDGVETVDRLWKVCPALQAVICTAYSDYSWHDIIGRFGHVDNLLILKKPFETVEVLQLAHALTRKWLLGQQARLRMDELEKMAQERAEELTKEVSERAQAQAALLASEEKFSKAFQSSPMPMAIQSRGDGRFVAVNSSFTVLTGHATEQIVQHTCDDLRLWKDAAALKAGLQPEGRLRNHSCVLVRQDGEERNIVLCAEPLTANAQPCLLIVAEDITEKLKLEAGLRQAQKLEVVGRLVAGVAHEFNNVLGVIQGHASLLQSQLAADQRPTACTERILQASTRAANYTKQLLGITRQQPIVLKAVHLAACIQRAQQLLEQSLGEDYRLVVALDEKVPPVCADECNMEQVLINLVLNARDAMVGGGDITIEAQEVDMTDTYVQRRGGTKSNGFVRLTVSDHGKGVPPEIASHIFDPFFTTKEIGKGTGLGLWMVQGIVRRHGGWIELASEVGKGSSFKIFLPVWSGSPPEAEEEPLDMSVALAESRSTTPAHGVNGQTLGRGRNQDFGTQKLQSATTKKLS